jgi:hypothetical protein
MICRGPSFSILEVALSSVSWTGDHTGRLRKRDNLLTDRRGGKGLWEWSRIIRLVLRIRIRDPESGVFFDPWTQIRYPE